MHNRQVDTKQTQYMKTGRHKTESIHYRQADTRQTKQET